MVEKQGGNVENAKDVTVEPQFLKNKEAIAKTIVHLFQNADIPYYIKKMLLDRLFWANTENDDEGKSRKYEGQRYWSSGALEQLLKNKQRSKPYWTDLRHDHSIPKNILRDTILAMPDKKFLEVKAALGKYGTAVILSKDEDAELTTKGLKSKMPQNDAGEEENHVFARYRKIGLKICKIENLDRKNITKTKIQKYLRNQVT